MNLVRRLPIDVVGNSGANKQKKPLRTSTITELHSEVLRRNDKLFEKRQSCILKRKASTETLKLDQGGLLASSHFIYLRLSPQNSLTDHSFMLCYVTK